MNSAGDPVYLLLGLVVLGVILAGALKCSDDLIEYLPEPIRNPAGAALAAVVIFALAWFAHALVTRGC